MLDTLASKPKNDLALFIMDRPALFLSIVSEYSQAKVAKKLDMSVSEVSNIVRLLRRAEAARVHLT